VSFLRITLNSYGTQVSEHRCGSCGGIFTVCLPVTEEVWGEGCLAEGCHSYDEARDIDKVWDGVQAFVQREDMT
jgi:hypothetical protein